MSRPVLKFSVFKTEFALESETRRSSAAGATRVRVLGPVARVAWPGQLAMSTKACPMPKVPQPRVALGPVAKSMAPAAPRQSRVLGVVPREGPRGGPSLLQTHRHAPKLGQVPKCGAKRPRESRAGQVLGPAPRHACAVPVARAEQVRAKPEASPPMPMAPPSRAALEPRIGKRKRPTVLGAVPREAMGAPSASAEQPRKAAEPPEGVTRRRKRARIGSKFASQADLGAAFFNPPEPAARIPE